MSSVSESKTPEGRAVRPLLCKYLYMCRVKLATNAGVNGWVSADAYVESRPKSTIDEQKRTEMWHAEADAETRTQGQTLWWHLQRSQPREWIEDA